MNAEREIEALELQLCEADCQITALGSDLRQAQENARKYEDRYFETKAALRNLNCRIHSGYDFNADPDGITKLVGDILGD
jgi:chromosome segregation ATPase